MADEELSTSKIAEEIRNLRADTQKLNRPFYRKNEFWTVVVPVFSLLTVTIWGDFLSPLSGLERQKAKTEKATLESNKATLESNNATLELNNATLETKRETLKLDVRKFEETKTRLFKENAKLNELAENLRHKIHNSERALKVAEDRLVCREIDLSIRAVKDLAYSLAAPIEQFNLPALARIAARDGYLSTDDANALRLVDSDSWYTDWKRGDQWFDNPMDRSAAAQYVAQVVVGSIDIESYLSPFTDGTDADREYPLSRLFSIAIERVRNDAAKKFLTLQMDHLKAAEQEGKSSLLPNVSNNAIGAVAQVKSIQVDISKAHLVEFAKEAIRVKEAHTFAITNFRSVMNNFARRCRTG